MAHALLKADNVTKKYQQAEKELLVLNNVDASFEHNKTYAITGASGSGKSTLLYLLSGLDVPTSGSVFFNEVDIQSFSQEQRSHFLNKQVGLVFQQPYLIKELTILQNVMLKGLIAGKTESECTKKAYELLSNVGIADKSGSLPTELSGGQQQRVALARALFNEPLFLLADEPTGNLDNKTGNSIVDLLLTCQQQWGMGLIISSHDAYVTQKMETIYELKNGVLLQV